MRTYVLEPPTEIIPNFDGNVVQWTRISMDSVMTTNDVTYVVEHTMDKRGEWTILGETVNNTITDTNTTGTIYYRIRAKTLQETGGAGSFYLMSNSLYYQRTL